MKTARMTIVLDPVAKAQIEERARGAAISTGEYVRRASQSYEAELDEATLERLVIAFEENVRAMQQTLAEANAYSQARMEEIAAIRRSHHGDR